jgi:hypothetical protein
MKRFKRALLPKLNQKKLKEFDLIVDFDEFSSNGHLARSKMLVNELGYNVGKVYKIISKRPSVFMSKKCLNKGVVIDSFYLSNEKVKLFSVQYGLSILIDDGPVRYRYKNINYVNWDLRRHLVQRFHKKNNVYSSLQFFPFPNFTNAMKTIDSGIFLYTSNDSQETIHALIKYLKNKFDKKILVVGINANFRDTEDVIFYTKIDEDMFNTYISKSSIIVSPGGFTFYKSKILGKKSYIYENDNKNVGWERSVVSQMGGGIIRAKDI